MILSSMPENFHRIIKCGTHSPDLMDQNYIVSPYKKFTLLKTEDCYTMLYSNSNLNFRQAILQEQLKATFFLVHTPLHPLSLINRIIHHAVDFAGSQPMS